MATVTLIDRDVQTRDAVLRQLDWDPAVDSAAVGVTARGGTVTLTGFIDTYSGKLAAERAAKLVNGVRGVANDIQVRLKLERTDADIAQDAVKALQLRSTVPETVQAVVHNGHITLTGRVAWLFEKHEAEKAVRHVKGIRGCVNYVDVAHGAVSGDVHHRIVEALHRSTDFDVGRVVVGVTGHVATLTGTVKSWIQREAAERAASSAPGIERVDNQISVEGLPDVDEEIC